MENSNKSKLNHTTNNRHLAHKTHVDTTNQNVYCFLFVVKFFVRYFLCLPIFNYLK